MGEQPISVTLRLFARDSGDLLREVVFAQRVIKIGRLASSHVCLEDRNVSRMHAILEVIDKGNVSLTDLASTTGTFLNGQRISKASFKTKEAVITIGDVLIRISF